MTPHEIIEGNKLIAEFMGLPCPPVYEEKPFGFCMGYGYHSVEELEYHSSWDWLMPLVEKIERMGGHITIGTNKIECQFQDFRGSSRVGFGYTKIQSVWEVIVEFIKWYNTQKTKQ